MMIARDSQKRWNAFVKQGLPTKSRERWKYTDFSVLTNKNFIISERENITPRVEIERYRLREESILLVFVNGYFVPTLSDLQKLPGQVIACSRNDANIKHADLFAQHRLTDMDTKDHVFANLNADMCEDGLFLFIPDGCTIAAPIHLLSLAAGEKPFIANPQHVIVLGKHSQLTLIEEYAASASQHYMMNMVTNIVANQEANLKHIKVQHENNQAVHMANIFIKQEKDSHVELLNFSSGSEFARDEVVVKLLASGAHCRTAGFYHLRHPNQYIDHHIDITHSAPRSQSEMLYKGIINQKSRAVFNGKLYVDKEAQKTLAYQANHNVLLSNEAEVYSKPELEIYADDVKCKHGATTGQLDQDALFYLRARGIEHAHAVNMLLQGFADEIIQRVSLASIRQRIEENVL